MVVGSKRVRSTTTVATRIAATPTPASSALRVVSRAEGEAQVEQQPVDRHHHEAHQQRAAHTGQCPRRRYVVERDAEVGPREPTEREAAAHRLEHDPHRGGEER